jgi:hypothetical protein
MRGGEEGKESKEGKEGKEGDMRDGCEPRAYTEIGSLNISANQGLY